MSRPVGFLALLALAAVACAGGRPPSDAARPSAAPAKAAEGPLWGPTWELAAIRYADDATVVPDDPAKYTLRFEADGRVFVRADCNRGAGTWKADGPSLTLGPIGMTRMMCPPESIFDRYTQALDAVASYVIRDGTLHLAMRIDSGILEFRPAP